MNIFEKQKLGKDIKVAYLTGGYDKVLSLIMSHSGIKEEIKSVKSKNPQLILRLKKWINEL